VDRDGNVPEAEDRMPEQFTHMPEDAIA